MNREDSRRETTYLRGETGSKVGGSVRMIKEEREVPKGKRDVD